MYKYSSQLAKPESSRLARCFDETLDFERTTLERRGCLSVASSAVAKGSKRKVQRLESTAPRQPATLWFLRLSMLL